MGDQDIRWEQRFSNYLKAFHKFEEAVKYVEDVSKKNENSESVLNDILKQGLIQSFEYTYELAWNVMKDYAEYQGNPNIPGSRTAIREALQMELISEGKIWMEMIESRIRTTHTYNEDTADDIYEKILKFYHPAFLAFKERMETLKTIG